MAALCNAVPDHDPGDQWVEALTWARPYWRAAYLRQPFDSCVAPWLAD